MAGEQVPPPSVERLVLTREFGRAFERLTPASRRHGQRVLSRLIQAPDSPMIRISPIPTPDGCYELRLGYNDRAVLRFDGPVVELLTVFSFREVAGWNTAVRRRLATPRFRR